MSTIETVRWESCYDQSWRGEITDEAFAHPAKFSRGLIERIADYVLANGGGTCIVSSPPFQESRPFQDPSFVAVDSRPERHGTGWHKKAIKDRHDSDATYGQTPGQLGAMPSGTPPPASQQQPATPEPPQANGEPLVVVTDEILREIELELSNASECTSSETRSQVDCIVSSPPFSSPGCQPVGKMPSRPVRSKRREMGLEKKSGQEYGTTPGQLGAMPPGKPPESESDDTRREGPDSEGQ